ncbi:hypothetical protein FHT69_002966 [Rhizobium sp. BK008]|nr:hypothetical protein [Rhizobium sp. BK008]
MWFYTDLLGAETTSLDTVVDQVENCFEIASDLGAEVVVMTPVDSLPQYMSEKGAEKVRDIVEQLVPLARSYIVTIGLESGRSQGTFARRRLSRSWFGRSAGQAASPMPAELPVSRSAFRSLDWSMPSSSVLTKAAENLTFRSLK